MSVKKKILQKNIKDSSPFEINNYNNAFSSSYLTLISIIQGSILGYIFTSLDKSPPQLPYDYLLWTTSMLMIIAIWFEYLVGTLIYCWFLNIYDAFIPFTIGICEYYLVKNINNCYWYLAASIFCGLSTIAYINQHLSAKKTPNINSHSSTIIGYFRQWNYVVSVIGTLTFLSLFLIKKTTCLYDANFSLISFIIMFIYWIKTYFLLKHIQKEGGKTVN